MATSTKDVLKLISTIKLFSVLAGPLLVLVELFFQVKHRFHKQSTKISIVYLKLLSSFFLRRVGIKPSSLRLKRVSTNYPQMVVKLNFLRKQLKNLEKALPLNAWCPVGHTYLNKPAA